MKFSIREDLESRSFRESVEILYISGPTRGDVEKIAACLGVSERDVREAVEILIATPGRRYDSVRAVKNS